MKASSQLSSFVLGLALFSMFFGSGNLIYPLFVGQLAGEHYLSAIAGFLLAAVAIPFCGVLAMVVFKGSYTHFFSCLGKKGGLALTTILLTVWIPLGSAPRCIALAYASIASNISLPPLWIFSIFYSLLVFVVICKKSRVLDFLGYILTPMLLACIGLLVYYGLSSSTHFSPSDLSSTSSLVTGLSEGYNTMDLIASFFFSSSIISLLNSSNCTRENPLRMTFKAGVVAMLILSIVYIGLIVVAAAHSSLLIDIPKEKLLAYLTKVILGPSMGLFAAATIFLACFSTSIALVMVFAEFLSSHAFSSSGNERLSTVITLIISFAMSIFGLSGVTFVTAPILQISYPLLLVLIVFNLTRPLVKRLFGMGAPESA